MTTIGPSLARRKPDALPSQSTALPTRAFRFLYVVSRSAAIRRHLAVAGYTEIDHQNGWRLLYACACPSIIGPPRFENAEVRAAIAQADAWDEAGFLAIRQALNDKYPRQTHFLFHDLAPGIGEASVRAIAILLERLDALEQGRGPDPKHDQQAMAHLSAHGMDSATRRQLTRVVQRAQKGPSQNLTKTVAAGSTPSQNLERQVRQWFKKWKKVAKAVLPKQSYLVDLGLTRSTTKTLKRTISPRRDSNG